MSTEAKLAYCIPVKAPARLIQRLSEFDGFVALEGDVEQHGRRLYTATPVRRWHCAEPAAARQALAEAEHALRQLIPTPSPTTHGRPFIAGLIGYLAYELGAQTLPFPTPLKATTENLLCIGLYLWCLNIDADGSAALHLHPACPNDQREMLLALLRATEASTAREASPPRHFRLTQPFLPRTDAASYANKVEQIRELIRSGDCYQVNLSQCWEAEYTGSPWTAYQALRQVFPMPYAAYLSCPDRAILSLSPEMFLRILDGEVESRPIKGTRPRGQTTEDDQFFATDLRNSLKDQAENLMIVDLIRNDLSRFCNLGSVSVENLFQIDSYPNVHHLVSTVKGQLKSDVSPLQALLSAFPGGSITGAPKMRAMQIIADLE
ncbi:MAG: anthranilate synthase component I family protein, partial [Gammaproteobacteria bacterium]|nr:anthranilate synthase component I family protein [Gammaproteobacteria bacterium]